MVSNKMELNFGKESDHYSSSCSYSWSSWSLEDEHEEAIDIVRRGREICSLVPGDKNVTLRGHLLTRLLVGETKEHSMPFVEKVKRYFRYKTHFQQLGSERGFTIRFGPWEEAPFRKSQGDAWYFSKSIQNTVESKPYSRGCWHQEYFWDGSKRKYYVRGFWATKDFEHPLLVADTSLKLMEQHASGIAHPEGNCLFKSLPKVPPYNGFVPAEKSFKLAFIQIFYKNADGVHSQNGSWQLTYNIDLPELWEPIGTEGHLFGEDNCKPSEENTEEMGTANAEDSEEDWF